MLWLHLLVYAKDLLTRLIDPILGIVAYGVLLALLCYLLWRNGLYQDTLESYYNPAKTVLLKQVNE
ncbi:hypothetical protein [Spirosoma endophyticum]|uniref:hypothetical protein n=1 Tax=Spirosoma endophyticum TaxID=662367 RepID=UPI0015A61EBB|nr:hypothetical protein [Spirosoma endophyticum]